MTKYQKNIEIAKILGFEFTPENPKNGINFQQIKYPADWVDEVKCSPCTDIPDFIKILNQTRDIAKTFRYGIPTHYKIKE